MDAQHQAIFARQLHTTMKAIEISQADPKMRAIMGSIVNKLLIGAGTDTWAELKVGLDRDSYDRVLAALQEGGKDMRRKQQPLGVRAMEAVGVALIARHQDDENLKPVVAMLDTYIEQCAAAFRKAEALRAASKTAQA